MRGNEPARRAATTPAKKAPTKQAAKKAPAKKAPAKKAPAKKAAGRKAPAKKPAKKAAKKAPAKKAAKKIAPSDFPRGAQRNEAEPELRLPELAAPPTDPSEVLGLREPFTGTDLRRAWRAFAARHHPDQGGDAATFTRGRGAYDALRSRSR